MCTGTFPDSYRYFTIITKIKMSSFKSEFSGIVRRSWQVERSDSGWGNRAAFAALSNDGQVKVWGDEASGGLLPVGLNQLLTRESASNSPWIWTVELASSTAAFAARRANGQVVAWGDAGAGGSIPAELQTALSNGVMRLFGLGQGFVALKADGSVIHWGASGSGISAPSGVDLTQPYRVVTSFDSLAILQSGRVLGCWGGSAGAQQWAERSDLRSALASGVQELVCNDAGFAARTASGQVITWGVPQGIGAASGVSITSRPDIVSLGSDIYEFHGFDASGKIYVWGAYGSENVLYVTGEGPIPWPYLFQGPINDANRMFAVPGGGQGWSLNDKSIYLYDVGGQSVYQVSSSAQDPVFGGLGIALIRNNGYLETFGYKLNLSSPNPGGFFSPSSKASDASWQAVRASGGAFAAVASNGQIGLWGDPATGAIPANPQLTQRLLEQHPATQIYNNAGAFVALSDNGTAISWGDAATGGDHNGAPLIFGDIDHLVSPWQNMRIDELGQGLLSLIANGKPNPEGQSSPLRVQEGDRLTAKISGDPNGDRSDTSGNQYLWQRNGQAVGDPSQASINLDALSTGTWSVTPTYYDLPGFQQTLAPLTLQVEQVDNGQSRIQVRPNSFTGPADQAFSAGNGKVAELVASLSGDPEGIRSIDRVQWFRDGEAIASDGTPQNSILLATEPGVYRFEATTTDNQGYTTNQSSGLIQIDPAGSVPSQSHLALGGLQTLWRLAEDGRSVERFDSTSLRMRQVDMAGAPGYLAISAASDGRAWALDNDGYACIYDAIGNRFIRQDGSGSGAEQRLNLGGGWRQIVAARGGSNTVPALWLLRDAPLDGGSNVAYVPGALAQGQTLADLKPITLNAGPQLRLLAVGDDQTPWGIDDGGNLWRWDAGSEGFALLAAGVGSHIRQLQMIDQAQVWGLDGQGVLQMWDSEKSIFKPVPLDSPFFTRRSELLTPGVTPTWESFNLSPLGGFVGIPRSGVTLPAGGTGLVSFDTSEISRLRSAGENPSQLQLLSGETLQDNGVRQVGQNLAFNLNNQVNVAYMLNPSRPGLWDGAAIVPKAQSGAELRIEPGPNRAPDGTRLPVLKLSWLSGLGNGNNQAYSSQGYVSPLGGLVFTPASKVLPSTANGSQQVAALARSTNTDPPETIQLAPNYSLKGAELNPNKDFGFNPDILSGGPGATYYKLFEKKLTNNWEMHNAFILTLGNSSSIKNGFKNNLKGFFQYELEFEKKASDKNWWNTGNSNTLKPKWNKETGKRERKTPTNEDLDEAFDYGDYDDYGGDIYEYDFDTKEDASKLAVGFSFQGTADINDWTDTSKWEFSDNISLSFKTSFPIYSFGLGTIQISATLGISLDYASKGFGLSSALPAIYFTDKEGKAADSNTPKTELTANINPKFFTDILDHPTAKAITENVLPPVDAMETYIIPIVNLFSGKLTAAASAPAIPVNADNLILGMLKEASLAPLYAASNSTDAILTNDSSGLQQPNTNPERKISTGPKVGVKIKFETFLVKADASAAIKGTWTWNLLDGGSFSAKSALKLALNIRYLWLNFRTQYDIPLTDSKPKTKALQSSVQITSAATASFTSSSIIRNLNDQILNSQDIANSFSIQPLSQLVRPDDSAIGVVTRVLPGNTGIFELCWVRGTRRSDGLTIAWDPNSLQPIAGSAGFTSNVTLVELSDGRLAVAGSHIAADNPLLLPISQLAPGTLYRIASDPAQAGTASVLDGETPQLGLPSDRVWAQLGSSLVATGSLRQGWQGDSLIAGASGSNDGAGALYILNGSALSNISDLSALEANSDPSRGLVILGSHVSGSLSGLGQRVADGGDTNSDGFSEIFASAPQDENGAGLVYMIYGGYSLKNLPGLKQGSITLDDLDGLQANSNTRDLYLQTFSGVSGSSGYGTILAGGQDLNGDQHSDALIGYAADSDFAGTVELWSSRAALKRKAFQGGVLDGPEQAIPHFDRSLLVGDRSSQTSQSRFVIHKASSVGDVNGDGYGDVVLSTDSMAALVFGNALMPVFWEAASVLPVVDQSGSLIEGAQPTTFTTSWINGDWQAGTGHRYVLSFSGQDLNGDGKISSTKPGSGIAPELNWVALRVDGLQGESQVALSPQIQDQWQGSDPINNQSIDFDLASGSFIGAVKVDTSAADGAGSWSFASDAGDLRLDQAATALKARLITSNAPGVLNAAGLGDFNGDGKNDVAFSQASYRGPNSEGTALETRPGQSAVLYGGVTLVPGTTPLAVEQGGLLLDAGGELSAIGDWNRDGMADLLIRDPYAESNSGNNVLLLGRQTIGRQPLQLQQELLAKRAQLLQGSRANSLTGASAAAGDFAGKGQRELVIGAPNTVSEADLERATAGMRVLTASQRSDGQWNTPTLLPDFGSAAPGQQHLSTYTAVGNRILATWVHSRSSGTGATIDELWAAFQDPSSGQWTPAHKLQENPNGEAGTPSIGEVQALALRDASQQPTGAVLLAWTTLDATTGRSFLFQSTYDPSLFREGARWSAPLQQDPNALLLANQDAISGSQLKLQLNPSGPAQRSQIWAEAGTSSEGDASAVINLRRSGDLSQALTLNYSTRDQSASAGSQYQHREGTVAFAAGESSVSVAIPLLDNGNLEYRTTAFAVDFSLPADQLAVLRPQLLLGNTPVASDSGLAILSVSAGVQDNDAIRMRAIDAGISLLGPLTGSTGEAAAASTGEAADASTAPSLAHTIALVADPGAQEGLGQVYALFVAATASSAANPGMDWKELNDIQSLDEPVAASQGRQLNVLIQPEPALAVLDGRAGFGTAMVKLRLNGTDYFAISAPGNPLDGTKPGRVYVVAALTILTWADNRQTANQPLILTDSNSLIIEQMAGGLFGSTLAAADLNSDKRNKNITDELIIGSPGSSSVVIIDGETLQLKRTGRQSVSSLNPRVISDPNSNGETGSTDFGTAITAIDLDHDGNTDLAIGAPKALPVRAASVFGDGPVVATAGAVYAIKGTGKLDAFQGDVESLVRGKTALILKGQLRVNDRGNDDDEPRLASEGPPSPGSFGFGEELGSALAALDLNSDEIKDLAIGAPQYTPDGTLRTGRVVTWFGNGTARWGEAVDLGSVSVEAGVTFEGQQDGGRVGASLAAAGDLNDDKNQDLAIGAPFEDGGAGRVYVAFGSQNRYGLAALKTTGNRFDLDATSPDSPFQTFEAPPGYQLGQSVVGLGDVNKDSSTGIGGDDLFLGSPTALFAREQRQTNGDIAIVPSGQTHLAWGRPWLGPNQSLDVPFTQGVGYLLPFGGVPLALGDLNGDGYGDYALLGENNDWLQTDPPDPAKKADATKLRIRFGAAVEYEQQQLLLSSFDLKPAGTPLASDQVPLVVAGDFDGDAFGDLIAYTNDGMKLLHGAPNLSVQGDAQTRWNTAGTPLSIGGGSDPISQLASGDFDGDGFDDLAVVNQGMTLSSSNPVLSIFWGSATGLQFGGSKLLASGQKPSGNKPGIDGLIALDSNGDGIDELALYGNDLATFWSSTPKSGWGLQLLTPIRNSSDPVKKAVQSLSIETGPSGVPSALSSGDLNGDGFADLLIDHGGNKINVLTGNRQTFLQPSNLGFIRSQAAPDGSTTLQRSQLARFIGDVNADGLDDLLFSPTSPAPLTNSSFPLKHGPYSFVYLGNSTGQGNVTIPAFWDAKQDNGTSSPDRLKAWAAYGYTIESLPGEATAYRTGGLGDINGDGFDEAGFSSNQLYVSGKAQQRPHSIFIYGASRLSPDALKTTTSNDGTSVDDTLHQLGSAGKQELLMRGRIGSDLLQVHADPYGATLSIPSDGENAGRLTVSASNGSTLWTQRNSYELILRDGKLQIIRTKDDFAVKTWGNGDVDRVYLAPNGWLYLLKAGVDNQQFKNPDSYRNLWDTDDAYRLLPPKGVVGMAGWFENGFLAADEVPTDKVQDAQLVFVPSTGALHLVNRQNKSKNPDSGSKDLWTFDAASGNWDGLRGYGAGAGKRVGPRSAFVTLYEGASKSDNRLLPTQILNPGESLVDQRGATIIGSSAMTSLGELEASRRDLHTVVDEDAKGNLLYDPTYTAFTVKRSGRSHDRSLSDVFSNNWYHEDLAWSAERLNQPGPYVVAMDGHGRLTINAQNKDSGQIKPGSELAVLHPGNPDPFLPPIGSEPVLLRPGFSSDQITQAPTGSRSTNNNFAAVLKGGLDDDRLGVDALQRIDMIDGGPGVDTLFFSSQRSDGSGSAINLVGLGSRIRNIEAIEIPINNTLILDEAPLLNTPLHRLKLSSRGNADVIFHVREEYVFIGDQFDAGLAYRVYAKPNSNLQLWVQQGRVTLVQPPHDPGRSSSLTALQEATGDTLKSDAPIDSKGLAFDPDLVYRWYYNGKLIEGATEASYGDEALRTLTAGSYTRETDYTDSTGLRKTVSSAPLEVVAPPAVGGTLRILRTELDAAQSQRLANRQSGLSPQGDQLQLLLTPGRANETPAVQRVDISSRTGDNPSPSGLIALVNPGQAWPEAVSGAGVYDFTGDGSLDTLTWQPSHGSSVGDNLHAALLQGSRAQLAALPNGLLGFVVQDPVGSVRGLDVAALQSLRVSLLAAPPKVSAVLAIALNEGESLTDLSNAERQQRALALLSHQDVDGAPLASGADRQRQLWLRADQQLVLLELPGKTLSDWDGSLASEPLRAIQQLPQSGIAGARLQMGSNSGLLLELETLDTPQDLNSFVGRSQTQAPVLDFRGLDGLSLQANLEVAREAAYNSTMGFYAIDGLDGSIRDPLTSELVAPGDPNYGTLATTNRIQALDGLSSADRSSTSRSFQLTESRLLAPYAVIADPQLGAQIYYGFSAANSDGISHFRSFGNNVIGLEDLRGGGDLDYDDNLMHLQLIGISI